uniref:Uncharacterized protein n=1 Tax=Tanacetum cinerariifolium TaxID=118510 RepID=A0A6L2LU79_TANCI|nr:hypothetical protein [Tanacetum cinerariifolium]
MTNVPPNDPNVDASAIVLAHVNPVGLGNGFSPYWVGDPEEDPEEDGDDVMEMDDEAEVIDPYMDDGSNNPPPLNSEDEETPPTYPIIPDADGQPIPPIASDGLEMVRKDGKTHVERIDTKGRMKKKFKEQDLDFVGLGCDNIKMDRAGSKVFEDKKVLEKDLVNERNRKEFYQEFGEYMCRMLQNRQKSKDSFHLPLGSDAAIVVATSGIDEDDDDTALMDS